MSIEERFLKYISFDTQSDPQSSTTPSSMKQLELGKYLVEEMKKIGIEDARLDQSGIVYGTCLLYTSNSIITPILFF